MSRSPALIALLILAILSPTVGALESETFIYTIGGQSFGEETFSVESRGDTLLLDGRLSIHMPAPRELHAVTRLLEPADRLLDYLLVTDLGDSIAIESRGDSLTLSVRSAGRNRRQDLAAGDAKPLPLDNAISSHYWLLARQLHRDPEATQPLLALVPQVLWSGRIERLGAETVNAGLAGELLTVTRHGISIAGLLSELDLDARGRFMGMRVPMQSLLIRREHYEFEAPDATDGPHRSFPTEEVKVEGGGPPLVGVLTLPDTEGGPWPACVLLHGSGPGDRHMTLGPNQLFVQLAEGLAARGIATLRYDKRTYALNHLLESGQEFKVDRITLSEEVMDDARAAYGLLAGDARMDTDRLFLLGLSLGAAAAPTLSGLLAAEGTPPAGLLMLAPPGRDLLTVMLDQFHYLNARGLFPDAELQSAEKDVARLREGDVIEGEMILGARPYYWDSVLYWRPWRDYRAQPAPALLLFGERDYQITAPDRAVWQSVLDVDGRPGSALYLLPGRNHLFLPGKGEPGPAEYGRPGEMGPELMDLLGDWIQAR